MNRYDFIYEEQQGLDSMKQDAYEEWRDDLTVEDYFNVTDAEPEVYEIVELLVDDYLSGREVPTEYKALLDKLTAKMWEKHKDA